MPWWYCEGATDFFEEGPLAGYEEPGNLRNWYPRFSVGSLRFIPYKGRELAGDVVSVGIVCVCVSRWSIVWLLVAAMS